MWCKNDAQRGTEAASSGAHHPLAINATIKQQWQRSKSWQREIFPLPAFTPLPLLLDGCVDCQWVVLGRNAGCQVEPPVLVPLLLLFSKSKASRWEAPAALEPPILMPLLLRRAREVRSKRGGTGGREIMLSPSCWSCVCGLRPGYALESCGSLLPQKFSRLIFHHGA